MTEAELSEIAEQRMSDPTVLGRLVCHLRRSDGVQQRHHDGRTFQMQWEEAGDSWRCTVVEQDSSVRLARVDLHENATVRIEVDQPCRVTVSPEEEILCITRYGRSAA